MGRDELLAAAQADPSQLDGVAALDVRGNFMFDAANHRDFLGALVGTGARAPFWGQGALFGEAGGGVGWACARPGPPGRARGHGCVSCSRGGT